LRPRHRLAFRDLRGHAYFPTGPPACMVKNCGADVKELSEALNLKDAILVGFSLSCRAFPRVHVDAPRAIGALVHHNVPP
jgi:hypothetical protein